jgi:hypothetical protein
MRLLGHLLAFYVLFLSIIPCCLIDNCPDDKTEQSSGHTKGDEDCGSCSPFFSCEGCAAAVIAYEPAEFRLLTIDQQTVYTDHLLFFPPDTDYDFWQPPKLG